MKTDRCTVATHPSAANISGKYWANMKVLNSHSIARDDEVAEQYMNKSFEQIKMRNKA